MSPAKQKQFESILRTCTTEMQFPATVFDFGCGDGRMLLELQSALPKDCTFIGMDSNPAAIDSAMEKTSQIDFVCKKFVSEIPLPNQSVDAVISIDTLECITDKARFLSECARILKENGLLFIAHWDWDTQVYNSEYRNELREIIHAFCDFKQDWMDTCDGWMGRRIWQTIMQSGLFNGEINVIPHSETEFKSGRYGFDRLNDCQVLVDKGLIPKENYSLILAEQEELFNQGRYFYSINSYVFWGKKKKEIL